MEAILELTRQLNTQGDNRRWFDGADRVGPARDLAGGRPRCLVATADRSAAGAPRHAPPRGRTNGARWG